MSSEPDFDRVAHRRAREAQLAAARARTTTRSHRPATRSLQRWERAKALPVALQDEWAEGEHYRLAARELDDSYNKALETLPDHRRLRIWACRVLGLPEDLADEQGVVELEDIRALRRLLKEMP